MSQFLKQESFTADKDVRELVSSAELDSVREAFASLDTDGNGYITNDELSAMLHKCDIQVSDTELPKVMSELDIDGSGHINFDEFITYYAGMKTGKTGDGVAGKMMKRTTGFLKVEGAGGASHMFSEEEKIAFSEHINYCLADNADVARHLPLDIDNYDLFDKAGDGLIFCALINLAVPDTIDVRALNRKAKLNVYTKTENLNLALNASKSIGCQVVNIGAQDLIDGRPILILGLMWQIIRMQLTSQISLKNYPELVLLLDEGEDMAALLKLTPEDILLRWFNYHLKRAGSTRKVKNWTKDLVDSECYSLLLNQLNSSCNLVTGSDPLERAQQVCNNTSVLGIPAFLHPADIVNGNRNLNVGFVAQLFNTCPGLTLTEEIMDNFDFASVMVDDVGDSREERVFRMWINSLNIPDVYVNNLFEDMQDGFIILMLEDTVQPGVVTWKRVNKGEKAKSRFKKVENCNYAVDIAKEIGLSVVNIGGLDLVDKKKKLILAVIWQLMRRHTINLLHGLASRQGISEITDEHIITWANDRVQKTGKTGSTMSSFRDSSLKSGLFLLNLVGAIEPRAVNPELVTEGDTADKRMDNAKYAISLARKVGACVFLTPEDIVEVKSKMIMTFVSSLWATDLTYTPA